MALVVKQNVAANPLDVGFFLLSETLREQYDRNSASAESHPALGLKASFWVGFPSSISSREHLNHPQLLEILNFMKGFGFVGRVVILK
jgi:hypothetical protein